jgi:YcxB-like protein
MKLEYCLTENDFLQHQLFLASKSPRIRNKRTKSWLLAMTALLLIGFIFYQAGNITMTYCIAAFALYTAFFYRLYLRSHYKKHYLEFIRDNFKYSFNQTFTMSLMDDHIQTSDKTGESKINHTEIAGITETGHYFYLHMKSGGSFIIPKFTAGFPDDLRNELQKTAQKLHIPFTEDLNWEWK